MQKYAYRERDLRARKRDLLSFIRDYWIGKTYFLLPLVGKPCVRLTVRWFTLPPVVAVSVNSNLQLKIPNNGHANPENDLWISTPDLGETTVLKLSKKTFIGTEWLCESPKVIKLKFTKYLLSLSPSFSSFATTFKKMPVNWDGVRRN